MKIINTGCLRDCTKAALVISKLSPLTRFRITLRNGDTFSAIRGAVDTGYRFQTWNSKTKQWDGLPLNPWLVKQVKFY